MSETVEEWRPIPGYDGLYEVSSLGRVRSYKESAVGVILRPYLRRGRMQIALQRDGKATHAGVHQLVAAAWLGPRPAGLQVNHIDGDKRNDTPGNLEYVTQAENIAHAVRLDLHPRGERHGNSSLFPETVIKIRRLYGEGMTRSEIVKLYGIPFKSVENVIYRRRWTHLPAEGK